jgi:hypothetical protein
MIQIIWILLISTLTLFLHEVGHYISAKILHLTIKKIGVTTKPFPRVYVAVIDYGISLTKRTIYLASGNVVTILSLSAFLFFGHDSYLWVRVLVFQILIETNPFLSDYATLFFYLKNQKCIDSIPIVIRTNAQKKEVENMVKNMKENYFMSKVWLIHFGLWAILVVTFLKHFAL